MGYQPSGLLRRVTRRVSTVGDGDVRNIIPSNKPPENYLMCCKCPNCKAIFTVELEQPPKWWGLYRTPCPECSVSYDWIRQEITKTEFKFTRWWRQRMTFAEFVRSFMRKE